MVGSENYPTMTMRARPVDIRIWVSRFWNSTVGGPFSHQFRRWQSSDHAATDMRRPRGIGLAGGPSGRLTREATTPRACPGARSR